MWSGLGCGLGWVHSGFPVSMFLALGFLLPFCVFLLAFSPCLLSWLLPLLFSLSPAHHRHYVLLPSASPSSRSPSILDFFFSILYFFFILFYTVSIALDDRPHYICSYLGGAFILKIPYISQRQVLFLSPIASHAVTNSSY